jgi:tRNA pseudouridine13 synthase
MPDLPRVLSALRPAAGLIKADYEDFRVEEVPLYPACGSGTHAYFLIEKRGLSTIQAVHDLALALNVRRRDIGFAGLKDARAVTRQWMSIEHVDPERVRTLVLPRIRVLEVTRHTNKLRLGHLRANRFVIRVRQTEPDRLVELQEGLRMLERVGVPNYFGEQRFGDRGDGWEVGRAILHDRLEEGLDIVLGRPAASDPENLRQARMLYEAGEYEAAARLWPRAYRDERRALRVLSRQRGTKRRAFLAIDRGVRRLYVSAFQSHLFNQVVAQRLPAGLGRLWPGDLAFIHASGAVFRVVDAAAEQPRADSFEVSPTGPLFGYRMTAAGGQAGELETLILAREQLAAGAFRSRHLRVKGQRRPLRFRPQDTSIQLGADAAGAYLELRFMLPRGCYATALLRELFAVPDRQPPAPGGRLMEDGDTQAD